MNLKLSLIPLVAVVSLVACQNKKGPTTAVAPPPPANLQTVYFDLDKAAIRDDQMSVLNSNSRSIKNGSNQIVIEGHCDERGTNEYNMALGDRRARSIENYLTNLGVDPSQLTTVSYGEERPNCGESNESCWWQNRRGEFRKR